MCFFGPRENLYLTCSWLRLTAHSLSFDHQRLYLCLRTTYSIFSLFSQMIFFGTIQTWQPKRIQAFPRDCLTLCRASARRTSDRLSSVKEFIFSGAVVPPIFEKKVQECFPNRLKFIRVRRSMGRPMLNHLLKEEKKNNHFIQRRASIHERRSLYWDRKSTYYCGLKFELSFFRRYTAAPSARGLQSTWPPWATTRRTCTLLGNWWKAFRPRSFSMYTSLLDLIERVNLSHVLRNS